MPRISLDFIAKQTSECLGLTIKLFDIPKRQPVPYCGRYFYDSLTSLDSIQDPVRSLAKIHLGIKKYQNAEEFGVVPSGISYIVKNKEAIISRANSLTPITLKSTIIRPPEVKIYVSRPILRQKVQEKYVIIDNYRSHKTQSTLFGTFETRPVISTRDTCRTVSMAQRMCKQVTNLYEDSSMASEEIDVSFEEYINMDYNIVTRHTLTVDEIVNNTIESLMEVIMMLKLSQQIQISKAFVYKEVSLYNKKILTQAMQIFKQRQNFNTNEHNKISDNFCPNDVHFKYKNNATHVTVCTIKESDTTVCLHIFDETNIDMTNKEVGTSANVNGIPIQTNHAIKDKYISMVKEVGRVYRPSGIEIHSKRLWDGKNHINALKKKIFGVLTYLDYLKKTDVERMPDDNDNRWALLMDARYLGPESDTSGIRKMEINVLHLW
ncbi:hypothetical protein A3Q56_03495 [Intoshia linei]|uniref:Uncharacterized protein n=1 Tax=Intoshia linei TaxID=1819745 RepID=A0A177B393_9BILA|nr:hypothetical protein A3Q56_03495 [Intoshia linei]